jgi:hypothetical protein
LERDDGLEQEEAENRLDKVVGCTLPAQQAVPPHRMNSHRNRVNRWEFITTLCSAAMQRGLLL